VPIEQLQLCYKAVDSSTRLLIAAFEAGGHIQMSLGAQVYYRTTHMLYV